LRDANAVESTLLGKEVQQMNAFAGFFVRATTGEHNITEEARVV
jgi:hypothetical protein